MPRASRSGYSNAAEDVLVVYGPDGNPAPPEQQEIEQGLVTAISAEADIQEDREDWTSAGISSSTSGSKQDKSGTSHQETESSLQSPAGDAESPSGQDPLKNQEQSSSASMTDGSTQETGSDQPLPQDSSEESAQATEATAPADASKRSKRTSAS